MVYTNIPEAPVSRCSRSVHLETDFSPFLCFLTGLYVTYVCSSTSRTASCQLGVSGGRYEILDDRLDDDRLEIPSAGYETRQDPTIRTRFIPKPLTGNEMKGTNRRTSRFTSSTSISSR